MKKPVTAVLDWLWDCLTYIVMNQGVVVSVRGSVVEMRFDHHLPPIYSLLRAGPARDIVIETLAQPGAPSVLGIALTPTPGARAGVPSV